MRLILAAAWLAAGVVAVAVAVDGVRDAVGDRREVIRAGVADDGYRVYADASVVNQFLAVLLAVGIAMLGGAVLGLVLRRAPDGPITWELVVIYLGGAAWPIVFAAREILARVAFRRIRPRNARNARDAHDARTAPPR